MSKGCGGESCQCATVDRCFFTILDLSSLVISHPISGSRERLDPPLKIAPIDQIHHLHPVRQQTEKQSVINTDARSENIRHGFEPYDPMKCRRLSSRQPAKKGERAPAHCARMTLERLVEFPRKFDSAQRLMPLDRRG